MIILDKIFKSNNCLYFKYTCVLQISGKALFYEIWLTFRNYNLQLKILKNWDSLGLIVGCILVGANFRK